MAPGAVTGIFIVGVDVSQRAQVDAALRERSEQLRLATEAADVGLWDLDLVTDTLYWPPRVKAMFGISPDVRVTLADFYAGLHPDDLAPTSAAFARALDSQQRATYDVEYRTIGKEDGVVRWLAAKGRGVFDADGRCIRAIGTVIDISVRKTGEARLRDLNDTLERRVAEALAERKLMADNGSGMSAEVAARAFDPFFTTKGVGKGSGLGLSQVYGMTRQLGGRVNIDSQLGRGTTVSLLLPAAEPPNTSPVVVVAAATPRPTQAFDVLVVDDDASVRRFLFDALEMMGHRVVEAADGPAALRVLDVFRPDLMVVDFAMPEMNGAAVADAARAKWPHLPVVVASGYADTELVEKALGSSARILQKPYDVQPLQAVLDGLMSPQPGSSSAEAPLPPGSRPVRQTDEAAIRDVCRHQADPVRTGLSAISGRRSCSASHRCGQGRLQRQHRERLAQQWRVAPVTSGCLHGPGHEHDPDIAAQCPGLGGKEHARHAGQANVGQDQVHCCALPELGQCSFGRKGLCDRVPLRPQHFGEQGVQVLVVFNQKQVHGNFLPSDCRVTGRWQH